MDRFLVENPIIKYLRNKKGDPRGILVAVKLPNGNVSVNYSYCNNKLDKFNKQMGLKIAIGRAMSNSNTPNSTVPRQVVKEISKFNDRVARYYRINKDQIYTW